MEAGWPQDGLKPLDQKIENCRAGGDALLFFTLQMEESMGHDGAYLESQPLDG